MVKNIHCKVDEEVHAQFLETRARYQEYIGIKIKSWEKYFELIAREVDMSVQKFMKEIGHQSSRSKR